jgi:hypothetical protein
VGGWFWSEAWGNLGGAIGWFVLVASSGLSSGLDHGGCQMLGLSSWRQLNVKVSVRGDIISKCGPGSASAPMGPGLVVISPCDMCKGI